MWASLLDATVNVVPEDASRVLQAGCSHLAGKLDGTSRHHLNHEAAVIVFPFLRKRRTCRGTAVSVIIHVVVG